MLSSTSHHNHFVVFEHPWIKFAGEKLVLIFSVTKDVVFSEAPGVDSVISECIAVVATRTYLLSWFSHLGLIVAIFQVPLPQISLDQSRPVEVVNVLQIFLLFLFRFLLLRGWLLLFYRFLGGLRDGLLLALCLLLFGFLLGSQFLLFLDP